MVIPAIIAFAFNRLNRKLHEYFNNDIIGDKTKPKESWFDTVFCLSRVKRSIYRSGKWGGKAQSGIVVVSYLWWWVVLV